MNPILDYNKEPEHAFTLYATKARPRTEQAYIDWNVDQRKTHTAETQSMLQRCTHKLGRDGVDAINALLAAVLFTLPAINELEC